MSHVPLVGRAPRKAPHRPGRGKAPATAVEKNQILCLQAQKLESIGRLAAGIAHEINTPTQYVGDNLHFLDESFGGLVRLLGRFEALLQLIRHHGCADELVSEVDVVRREIDFAYLFEEIPKAIGQSLEGIERVSRIVRVMKEFSHPDTGDRTPVDVNKAVENTIAVSRNEWKHVADVKTDFDESLPPVPCLPGELDQALLNVLINAAHAIADAAGDGSGEKGGITVVTRRDGEWAEIRVADTGPGIPEPIRDRIFDPFFTTKEAGRGTGQGLAIARAVVVDKHRGTLTFETEMGKGTTFILRLPLTAASVGEESAEHAEFLAEAR